MARQNIATEDPISITSTLESGLSKIAPKALAKTAGTVAQKTGNAVLGGIAGLGNLISADSSGMKVSTPNYSADSLNQGIKNTASNFVQGVSDSANKLGSSVTNLIQRSQGGQGSVGATLGDSSGVAANTNKPAPTATLNIRPLGNVGTVNTPSISSNLGKGIDTKPLTPALTENNGTYSINRPSGEVRGTISFQDGRKLSPDNQTRLAKDIEYNSLQSTKDNFAREAQLVAQRRNDFDNFVSMRALTPTARALENLKTNDLNNANATKLLQEQERGRIALGKQALESEQNSAKNALEKSKLGFQQNEAFSKLLASPDGQMLPLKDKLALSRQLKGSVDINTFKMVHDQDFLNNALQDEDSLMQALQSEGYPKEDIYNILNTYRQSEQ